MEENIMRDRMSDNMTEATEQGRRLMESAKDAAERAGSYAQASVHRLSGRAQDVAGRAQDVAGDLVEDAREQVERFTGRNLEAWTADIRRFVQDRPLQAIAITIGIGYVLGKILRRG